MQHPLATFAVNKWHEQPLAQISRFALAVSWRLSQTPMHQPRELASRSRLENQHALHRKPATELGPPLRVPPHVKPTFEMQHPLATFAVNKWHEQPLAQISRFALAVSWRLSQTPMHQPRELASRSRLENQHALHRKPATELGPPLRVPPHVKPTFEMQHPLATFAVNKWHEQPLAQISRFALAVSWRLSQTPMHQPRELASRSRLENQHALHRKPATELGPPLRVPPHVKPTFEMQHPLATFAVNKWHEQPLAQISRFALAVSWRLSQTPMHQPRELASRSRLENQHALHRKPATELGPPLRVPPHVKPTFEMQHPLATFAVNKWHEQPLAQISRFALAVSWRLSQTPMHQPRELASRSRLENQHALHRKPATELGPPLRVPPHVKPTFEMQHPLATFAVNKWHEQPLAQISRFALAVSWRLSQTPMHQPRELASRSRLENQHALHRKPATELGPPLRVPPHVKPTFEMQHPLATFAVNKWHEQPLAQISRFALAVSWRLSQTPMHQPRELASRSRLENQHALHRKPATELGPPLRVPPHVKPTFEMQHPLAAFGEKMARTATGTNPPFCPCGFMAVLFLRTLRTNRVN